MLCVCLVLCFCARTAIGNLIYRRGWVPTVRLGFRHFQDPSSSSSPVCVFRCFSETKFFQPADENSFLLLLVLLPPFPLDFMCYFIFFFSCLFFLFLTEEYTKISTPRQEVLFKKGSIGAKKRLPATATPAATAETAAPATPAVSSPADDNGNASSSPTLSPPSSASAAGLNSEADCFQYSGNLCTLFSVCLNKFFPLSCKITSSPPPPTQKINKQITP